MHIRKDDIVEVISGDDRGKRGRVLAVYPRQGKILVEGVNRVYKHLKPGAKNQQGGRLSKEMPVSISNVMLVCSACGKPARTGARFRADGTKERFCKKCKATIGILSPPRKAHASK